MKSGSFGRQVILLFLAVVAVYTIVFYFIQRKRVDSGPWVVEFSNSSGQPTLSVSQTNLAIREVHIAFSGTPATTNVTKTIEFGVPRGVPFEVPFGECVFFDARFLPGTVALQIHGHEVQLLPRVLTIDGVERAWRSGETITLTPATATTNTGEFPTKQY